MTRPENVAEQLRVANERFAIAADAAGIGVWDLDLIANTLAWDAKMFQLYGVAPEGFTGAPDAWQRCVHPDDLARAIGEIEQAIADTGSFDTEFRIVRPDGDERWIRAFARVIRDAESRPQRMTGINYDITDRKRAEEALREREERLRSIFRVAPTGFGVVSDRVLLEVNERVCQMVGRAADELLGKSARVLYPSQADFEDVGKRKYAQISKRGTGFVETRWQHKDGSVLDVLLGSTPIDPEDLTKGVTFVALDITERKQAERQRAQLEEQLHQAMKMEAVGRLAGGVAHDFNNLLTAIVGTAELMLFGELPATQRGDIESIYQAGQRAAELTRQLLAFSRKQVIAPVVVQPNAVLDTAQRMVARLVGEHIDLVFQPAADLGCVKADPSQLDQILVNLVVNARDAMPDGGRLTVTTRNVGHDELPAGVELTAHECVEIAVADTGAGMDAETQRRIFEPFFSTKVQGQGTGLGLATVYGIVRQNGGWVGVTSTPGEGSTFRVLLPRVKGGTEEQPASRAQEACGGQETVLLVEDEAVVRRLACRMLTKLGYRVLEAEDGAQALRLYAQHKDSLDLLVSDVVMPGLNGRELYQQLAEQDPGLKVLFFSGYSDELIAERGLLQAGLRLLRKPFSQQELARAVRSALE